MHKNTHDWSSRRRARKGQKKYLMKELTPKQWSYIDSCTINDMKTIGYPFGKKLQKIYLTGKKISGLESYI